MKKWLTVLLALAMMLSTACAVADDLRLYRQTTGGEATVTLSNKGTGVYQATLESGGVYRLTGEASQLICISNGSSGSETGSVSLTLDGVTINSTGTALRMDHFLDVNLILKGSNLLTAVGDGLDAKGSVRISEGTPAGSSLNVTATGKGICSSAGNVTISGGTVNVTQSGSDGIFSYAGMEISGGTVNVTADGNGIFSPAGVKISGGRVDVQSGGCGIIGDFTGDVTISGGTVIAKSTGDNSYGIGGDHVTISGKDTHVTASGYDGIGAADDVTILGGTVDARSNGRGQGNFSAGIHSDRGDVMILGGTVIATATGETGRGILSLLGNVTISGGDVHAMGRVRAIHSGAGLKVDDKLHSMGSSDGLSDWTPAAPEHAGGYQAAWFAPGVPVIFRLGGGAKTVRVPADEKWLMPQPEMLSLTVPKGHTYTGVWLHDGAPYTIGASAPQIKGGETFTMETSAAAADLPRTGDPSMLGAWALLLSASAMGLGKMKKKS